MGSTKRRCTESSTQGRRLWARVREPLGDRLLRPLSDWRLSSPNSRLILVLLLVSLSLSRLSFLKTIRLTHGSLPVHQLSVLPSPKILFLSIGVTFLRFRRGVHRA